MKQWNNWFAWYPIGFGPNIAWLCTVQRHYNNEEKCWYYRWPLVNGSVTRIHKAK